MDGDASRLQRSAVSAIEQSPGARLVYRIASARDDEISVAKWKLDNVCVATGDLAHGILLIRTSGGATVTRRARGETVRKRPGVGEVTYASAETPTRWASEGSSEALHVYLPTARVRRFCEEELGSDSTSRIDDFFAVADPWLQGYFQMVSSEIEIFNDAARTADPLFFAQTEHMLLRHLLSWHSDASGRPRDALGAHALNPLPPNLMRRVQAYVEAHLAEEIRLSDLASLSCMSIGHFLRGFRVAAGTTPYHYVLEQRLQKARSLLRSTPNPITRIAADCGFKRLSHLSAKFHGRFGMSPSKYRAAGGRTLAPGD